MASYTKHRLSATLTGIHHYEIKSTANPGKKNTIFINTVEECENNEYDISFTVSNLSDDIKNLLYNESGNIRIEIGRMNRDGGHGIARFKSKHGKAGGRKVKEKPNHHFKPGACFTKTIEAESIHGASTFTIHVTEQQLLGGLTRNPDNIHYRYKSVVEAHMWKYLVYRIKLRLRTRENTNSSGSSPYRLNSDEIVTYCTFE